MTRAPSISRWTGGLRPALSAVIWACGVVAAMAGPFDGVYVTHPERGPPDLTRCAALEVLIADDRVSYFDVQCRLSNPVQIRGMDALLYDSQCTLDGSARAGRVLIRRMSSGDVTLVTPFMDLRLAGCDVSG